MRRPIKPFAVETRRGGRKVAGPKFPTLFEDEKPPKPAPEWPVLRDEEDDGYGAAMRAADALFSRPASEAEQPAKGHTPEEPQRRILQSLTEEDHISRMLAAEEADRPKRGRKPREQDDALENRPTQITAAPVEAAVAVTEAEADAIPGYVRGHIYARYARHSAPRPGENWRKRSAKPLW